ncbi:hypothetical protein Leryth_013842 [Lithospermum erythrorhizon]|uniref:Uncharacterized protein n=1 Tax=Lithospermum erythrorhizon TaxID=34254 RepID=A0AAV3PC17_LITER|nr:hypothetical protein Leryth_013842 [Lithospermum erythrorhizon]
MSHMNYSKISKKNNGISRGFKLNIKKFSIQSLRAKFVFMFNKFFSKRLRFFSYGGLLQSMRNMGSKRSKENYGSKRNLIMKDTQYRNIKNSCQLGSYGRSNSFYSEAISDCLDFIKKNSISLDEKPVLER